MLTSTARQIELLEEPVLYDCNSATKIESDQRYTPHWIIEKVDRVLDGIGLDPTANPGKTVQAMFHITEQQDCLQTDWEPFLQEHRTVFMNPPFSDSYPFIKRMGDYLRNGSIDAAITLTLAGVLSNKRVQPIIQELAVAVCHPFGRINFIGSGNSNDRDVVFILWGRSASLEKFQTEFDGLFTEILRK